MFSLLKYSLILFSSTKGTSYLFQPFSLRILKACLLVKTEAKKAFHASDFSLSHVAKSVCFITFNVRLRTDNKKDIRLFFVPGMSTVTIHANKILCSIVVLSLAFSLGLRGLLHVLKSPSDKYYGCDG